MVLCHQGKRPMQYTAVTLDIDFTLLCLHLLSCIVSTGGSKEWTRMGVSIMWITLRKGQHGTDLSLFLQGTSIIQIQKTFYYLNYLCVDYIKCFCRQWNRF